MNTATPTSAEVTRRAVILGVTGGIACYKSADFCAKLASAGYDVHVVMTENARKLISERIFLTLSRNPVLTDLFDAPAWVPGHVGLEEMCDALIVAPATANFIGKFANGIADDALTTTALTFRKKVLIAPAMNDNMWNSPALQKNLHTLIERGVRTVGPESGRLACGSVGMGRMSEVPALLAATAELFR